MTVWDSLIAHVKQALSRGTIDQAVQLVAKHLSHDSLLKFASSVPDSVLNSVDCANDTLPVLLLLCAKLQALDATAPIEPLLQYLRTFIQQCNPSLVQHMPDLMARVSHVLTSALEGRKVPILGIPLVADMIRLLQNGPHRLSSLHSDLCLLCLQARCFHRALPVLAEPIATIDKEGEHQLDVLYVLQYFYYGGMIYGALKQYDKAVDFYHSLLLVPSQPPSVVTASGYHKALLSELLVRGGSYVSAVPAHVISVAVRTFRMASQPYLDIVDAFRSGSVSRLQQAISDNAQTLTKDENMGLARQCIQRLHKRNLQQLTRTFLTLSLSDVAQRVHLADNATVIRLLLEMIEDGEIFASIDMETQTVRFLDDAEEYNTVDMARTLQTEIAAVTQLEKLSKQLFHNVVIDPSFIRKALEDEDARNQMACDEMAF